MIDYDFILPDVTDQAVSAQLGAASPHPDIYGGRILEAALIELQTLADVDHGVLARSIDPYYVGFVHRGVPYRPAVWFPGLSSAERKAYSRAMLRLEWDGFAFRVCEEKRDRVSHLRPTLNGLLVAFDTVPGASTELVCTGLRRTKWGAGFADYLATAFKPPA